ncbi:hypothetical protein OG782_13420 [Streptomyces sp. NBC_00876]|uniref:hypothetical protein n=1 Tax=Streptomyces sp. NBC_00876 TaxID=2975853 RepID=UPI00386CAC94|nr:hypothetical protein OG782_13420 [Streptomyces sp. NBC_00876]
MHPDTHLSLHRIRSAELRREAADFRLVQHRVPRKDLRTRLGWTMVELGLRLMPNRPVAASRAPRPA